MGLKQRINYFLVRKAARLLIRLLIRTCKLEISGFKQVEAVRRRQKPIIYAFWHRHIFVTIYRFQNTGARPLISLSEDGELVSQVAKEFGMNPVRGSSSRGGARAFMALANTIRENRAEVLITADGPKGPPGEIKDGTLRLAQKTGSVIVPVSWFASREKVFPKTWDKFKIPLPFSKITYIYGPAFEVPEKVPREEYGHLKEALKQAIDSLEKETAGHDESNSQRR